MSVVKGRKQVASVSGTLTLQTSSLETRIFLAARSLCTKPFPDR